MMRDGMVFELQMPVHPIKDSGSLFSLSVPTPTATDGSWNRDKVRRKVTETSPHRGVDLPLWAKRIVGSEYELLRTPAASEAERGHQPEEKARARGGQVTLSGQFLNLPTPTSTYGGGSAENHLKRKPGRTKVTDLRMVVEGGLMATGGSIPMLPTPNTMDDLPPRDESKIDRSKGGFSNVRETVVRPNFDRFEPVVRRWEQVTGMEAPAPTQPDGKDGAHRLSSKFTEWMMGLEPGWVTGHGLSRKDELKACGNGVVPQQAELALRLLLEVDDV
jgi:hypothetical protein